MEYNSQKKKTYTKYWNNFSEKHKKLSSLTNPLKKYDATLKQNKIARKTFVVENKRNSKRAEWQI